MINKEQILEKLSCLTREQLTEMLFLVTEGLFVEGCKDGDLEDFLLNLYEDTKQ